MYVYIQMHCYSEAGNKLKEDAFIITIVYKASYHKHTYFYIHSSATQPINKHPHHFPPLSSISLYPHLATRVRWLKKLGL